MPHRLRHKASRRVLIVQNMETTESLKDSHFTKTQIDLVMRYDDDNREDLGEG